MAHEGEPVARHSGASASARYIDRELGCRSERRLEIGVRQGAAKIFEVRFRPGADTALALATAVAFGVVYYTSARIESDLLSFLLFTVIGTGLLCVILPAYYMLVIRKEPLASLGITKRRWVLALALSAFFAAGSLPQLLTVAADQPEVDLTAHLLGNGLVFWEPFFIYGWLQLRFERAFGTVPGIVLATLCFAGYHLGTFPLEAVAGFIVVGLLQGALFRASAPTCSSSGRCWRLLVAP